MPAEWCTGVACSVQHVPAVMPPVLNTTRVHARRPALDRAPSSLTSLCIIVTSYTTQRNRGSESDCRRSAGSLDWSRDNPYTRTSNRSERSWGALRRFARVKRERGETSPGCWWVTSCRFPIALEEERTNTLSDSTAVFEGTIGVTHCSH